MATMPSKKRKYNARFPAGRIKKIMQTDEEVGKVAQAVPIIIYYIPLPRTLELFVESLLSKALQVTVNRNAKTLSPSHVKQCILAESRFDFLRDLVKNIPDVSAAEEKELMSGESSPTSSRFSETSTPGTCDAKVQTTPPPRERDELMRSVSIEPDRHKAIRLKPIDLTPHSKHTNNPFTFPLTEPTEAMDLTKRPVRIANFYQETLPEEVQHKSVIKPNPSYTSPQPSTSYTNLTPVPPLHTPKSYGYPKTAVTPVTPVINIDFTKNLGVPEIRVLDAAAVKEPKIKVSRQNSKAKIEYKKEVKPIQPPVDIDSLNSGDLQIDEDYDT